MGKREPGFGTGANFHPGTNVKDKSKYNSREARDAVGRWLQKAESREKLLDILVPYIRVRGVQFLDGWLTQAISAKSDANAPPEEESQVYWDIALIGNIIWAASCFIPGAGVVESSLKTTGGMTSLGKKFYGMMQLGGAVVGAGTLEQMGRQLDQIAIDPSGKPTGKDVVARKLNEQRKKLGKQFDDSITSFASELTRNEEFQPEAFQRDREKFLEATDRALWATIFPSMEYEDLNSFYQRELTTLNFALTDFNQQYKTWSEARAGYAIGSPRYGYSLGSDEYEKRYQEFARRVPFRPHLLLF